MKRLEAKSLRRARWHDYMFAILIAVLGILTVWTGRMGARILKPHSAIAAGRLLDQLEIPRELPDAPLLAEDGSLTSLYQLIPSHRSVVSMYASWCGPCQDELEELADERESGLKLVVVTNKDEKSEDTRTQLDNLGLEELSFYIDVTGSLYEGGKVKAYPTTFLLNSKGRVFSRVVGYSSYQIHTLIRKATGRDEYDY